MKLVLEDDSEWPGVRIGAPTHVSGEVVFNTSMAGYIESLTDPSYRGQILVLTYPLVGNYGVPASRASDSIDPPFESAAIQVQGLVVQNYVNEYSHHSADRSLDEWLLSEGIGGLTGIDTRSLTRKLREHGTMRGWLVPEGIEEPEARAKASSVDMQGEVFRLACPQKIIEYPGGDCKILLIDVGAKDNIVRSLLNRDVSVIRAPWNTDWLSLIDQVDGILIGNGPGDPKDLGGLIEQLRMLIAEFNRPVFGICLGHQLLSLAAGADTFKLPYGHRGINQPVQDLLTRKCAITSQNHGYAVDVTSLPTGWEPWFVNVNDGTNEGVRSQHKPQFSVQFHPEAAPGPRDTGYLFDEFLSLCRNLARS